ncbi:MAG: amidoligase family protein [Candidatus Omnitrophica bacterium]|nr:amidoligase family protein [Candidatus Omnitrophota bacterium]
MTIELTKDMFKPYTANLMEDVTFGVEIECQFPDNVYYSEIFASAGIDDNNYAVTGYTGRNYNMWQAKSDVSINDVPGFISREFVSPVLHGTEGLEEVKRLVNSIKDHGGRVDSSCGLHVHIGYENLMHPDAEWRFNNWTRSQLINNMIDIFSEFDQSFMLMVNKSRWNKSYCARHKDYCEVDDSATKNYQRRKISNSDRPIAFMGHWSAVNLEHFFHAHESRKTVEIRLLEGTLDAEKIEAWVLLCQRFVHRAFTTKIRATGRTRKFTDFLSFMKCDRADLKRGFDRNENTKRYVDYLRKLAKQYNSTETPYYQAHCNFASYVRPKREKKLKNLAA